MQASMHIHKCIIRR